MITFYPGYVRLQAGSRRICSLHGQILQKKEYYLTKATFFLHV